MDTLLDHIRRLIYILHSEQYGETGYEFENRRVTLALLDNENIRFSSESFVGGNWHPMTSMEVATYDRYFLRNVAVAFSLMTGRQTIIPVGSEVPELVQFSVERPKKSVPKPKPKSIISRKTITCAQSQGNG